MSHIEFQPADPDRSDELRPPRRGSDRPTPLWWRLLSAVFLAAVAALLLGSLDAHAEGSIRDADLAQAAPQAQAPATLSAPAPHAKSPLIYASLKQPEALVRSDAQPSAPPGQAPSGFAALVETGTIAPRDSAPTTCLPGELKTVMADVAARFGAVSVESTHRGKARNRRAGGARGSLHLACRAVDFRVAGRTRAVMAFLTAHPEVGGLKVYRNGIIHVDNGERRAW